MYSPSGVMSILILTSMNKNRALKIHPKTDISVDVGEKLIVIKILKHFKGFNCIQKTCSMHLAQYSSKVVFIF